MSKLNNKKHVFTVYTMLFTLPGIPSIYYGSEWGVEGARTSTCDDMLRPAISPDQFKELHTKLTDHIARLARLHRTHPALGTGAYKELLLTNRQYAYARSLGDEHIITAVNIDDAPASFSFRLPMGGRLARDLFSEEEIAVADGSFTLSLEPCESKIFKIVG